MIFQDKYDETRTVIEPEINRLVQLAYKNSPHIGDLLIIAKNGGYRPTNFDPPLSPFVIGPGEEGHAEITHYHFITNYRKQNTSTDLFSEYLDKVTHRFPENQKERDKLTDIEENTIQFEMLIYLKFWEADLIIKKFYQLVMALQGNSYDWHFKIKESNRAEGTTRQDIILKKIKPGLEKDFPILYKIFNETFSTQIRNAIAHSSYSILGRWVRLNNYNKDDQFNSKLSFGFDEWINMFHNTLNLYDQYLRLNNVILSHYASMAVYANNMMEILVPDETGKMITKYLAYIPETQQWVWASYT